MENYNYNFRVSNNFVNYKIKDLFKIWLIPRHIRGLLRMRKRVFLNKKHTSMDKRISLNDKISFYLFDKDFLKVQHYPCNFNKCVSTLYENEDFIVVDKPAGMKMHPHSLSEDDTLLNYIEGMLVNKKSYGHRANAMITHRLDRDTSGVVIIAKNPLSVSIINRLFSQRRIKKTYIALVSGRLLKKRGKISFPIGKDSNHPFRRKVTLKGERAVTYWRLLHYINGNSLIKVKTETGRTNQIRLHLAVINHPIIGDRFYGGKNYKRLMLHALYINLPKLFSPFKQKISLKTLVPKSFLSFYK